jgi:DNA-binding Lrp family transcriptional regulator
MRELDAQEMKIAKALVRNPRLSDNRLGEDNAIPVRTVSRKRSRLEDEGLLRYFADVDMSESGTGYFRCRHIYIVRMRLGISVRQILEDVAREPKVVTVFTRCIYDSHLAEVDGRVALVMTVEGSSEADVIEKFQQEILPLLQKNHGENAVEEVSTISLLTPLRMLRNYLPLVNMQGGIIRPDWDMDSIFVG